MHPPKVRHLEEAKDAWSHRDIVTDDFEVACLTARVVTVDRLVTPTATHEKDHWRLL